MDVTPSVFLAPKSLPAGAPLAVQYAWQVGPQFAGLKGSYRAYVHFVDREGVILFTDDHVPLPPPDSWVPGEKYAYRRIVLSSPFPYSGNVRVLMGLYSASAQGERVSLQGRELGRQREYLVGDVDVLRQDPDLFPLCVGLSRPESDARAPLAVARILVGDAECSFPNPKQDVIVFLEGETEPTGGTATPRLEVAAGGGMGATVPLAPSPERTQVRLRIPASALGPEPSSVIHLAPSQNVHVFGLVVAPVARLAPEVVEGALPAAALPPEAQ